MSERFWASGHWQVKEGKAEEFIQQWKEWLSRSSENVPGFHHARLLSSLHSPQQFTSISEWATAGARDAWKASPAFQEGFEASKALWNDSWAVTTTRPSSSALPQGQAEPRHRPPARKLGAGRAETGRHERDADRRPGTGCRHGSG
jgi:heme-degrading monooxygenase HmoA